MGYLKILLFSEPSRQLWWYSLLSVSFVLFCLPIFVVLTKIFVYNLLWCNFPLVNGFARLNLVVGLDCFELWFCCEVLLIGKWDLVHQLLEVSDSVYPVCYKVWKEAVWELGKESQHCRDLTHISKVWGLSSSC